MELAYFIAASFLLAIVVFSLRYTPYRRIQRVKFPGELMSIVSSSLSLKASNAALDWIQKNSNLVRTLNSVEWRSIRESAHPKSALATYAAERRLERFRDELQFCETAKDVLGLVEMNAPLDRVMEFSAILRLDNMHSAMQMRIAASVWGKMWPWTDEGRNSLTHKRWERAKDKVTLESREHSV